MTMHTIRGSTGIIKLLYQFHANVICSCDMGIFLTTSAGAYQQAKKLKDQKIIACKDMKGLLLASWKDQANTGIIQWLWLLDAWLHHLNFHIEVMDSITLMTDKKQQNTLDCIWDYIQPDKEPQFSRDQEFL